MVKVKVLIKGYAKEIKNGWIASSTTVLIEDKGKKIIVDPGINRKLLLESLKRENLTVEDIDVVFMTHLHPDHNYLSGIFVDAIAMDDGVIYEGDKETEYSGNIPGTNIKVMLTPGHEKFHASLVVETDKGTIVVAGDVFWWMDDEGQNVSDIEELLNHKDPFVKDILLLIVVPDATELFVILIAHEPVEFRYNTHESRKVSVGVYRN